MRGGVYNGPVDTRKSVQTLKMAGFTIIRGEITAEQFDRDDVAICYIVNGTSVYNYGLSAALADKYPYADIYSARKKLYSLNRARVESRNQVGEVFIFKEPNRPFIIALVAHFGSGEPIESNLKNQEYMKTSTDSHFVAGIKLDTLNGRVDGLKRCIQCLSHQLASIPISTLYIPAGTGSTLRGDTWEKKYIPVFEQLVHSAQENNIRIVIVDRRDHQQQPKTPLRHWVPKKEDQKDLPLLSFDVGGEIATLMTTHQSQEQVVNDVQVLDEVQVLPMDPQPLVQPLETPSMNSQPLVQPLDSQPLIQPFQPMDSQPLVQPFQPLQTQVQNQRQEGGTLQPHLYQPEVNKSYNQHPQGEVGGSLLRQHLQKDKGPLHPSKLMVRKINKDPRKRPRADEQPNGKPSKKSNIQ